MAQLGARFHGMEEVVGSIPTRSTNFVKASRLNPTKLPLFYIGFPTQHP